MEIQNKVKITLLKTASKGMVNDLHKLFNKVAKQGVKHAMDKKIVPFRTYKTNALFAYDCRFFEIRFKFELLPIEKIVLQEINEIDEDAFYNGIQEEKSDPTTETGYKNFNTDE